MQPAEKKKVLIVDDLPVARLGTAIAVGICGYESDEAEDGLIALEKVISTNYVAILMDCDMPRMNGIECTMKIRELENQRKIRTPIIGLSADDDPDLSEMCIRFGMDKFLHKTFTQEELTDVLNCLIQN